MVGPAAKREAVAHLRNVCEMSERRACILVARRIRPPLPTRPRRPPRTRARRSGRPRASRERDGEHGAELAGDRVGVARGQSSVEKCRALSACVFRRTGLLATEEAVLGRQNRRGRGKWIGLLVVLSLVGGIVLRNRLPAPLVDGVHAAIAHPSQWLADRVEAIRGVPKGHPLPPPPPPVAAAPLAPLAPPPATVTAAAAPTTRPRPQGRTRALRRRTRRSSRSRRSPWPMPRRQRRPARPSTRRRPRVFVRRRDRRRWPAAAAQDSDDEPVKAAPPKPIAKPAAAPRRSRPWSPTPARLPRRDRLDNLIRQSRRRHQKKGHAQ